MYANSNMFLISVSFNLDIVDNYIKLMAQNYLLISESYLVDRVSQYQQGALELQASKENFPTVLTLLTQAIENDMSLAQFLSSKKKTP